MVNQVVLAYNLSNFYDRVNMMESSEYCGADAEEYWELYELAMDILDDTLEYVKNPSLRQDGYLPEFRTTEWLRHMVGKSGLEDSEALALVGRNVLKVLENQHDDGWEAGREFVDGLLAT